MCLILFGWKAHERFPLVLAANRDEFYERPSAPAAFWEDEPDLLAGRDLRDGGTWLGITRSGRLAALTNYRDPASLKAGAPSRGGLTADYLRGRESPEAYLDRIGPAADRYNGFGLVCGNRDELLFFSNRGGQERVRAGVHGLSNRLLDTPWPKVKRGRGALQELLRGKTGRRPGRCSRSCRTVRGRRTSSCPRRALESSGSGSSLRCLSRVPHTGPAPRPFC